MKAPVESLRILFATDGSESAIVAARWVATHFHGAPIDALLLHAIRMSIEDALHNHYDELAAAAEKILNDTQNAVGQAVTNISAVGKAAPTIAEIAKEQHAQLIVMGHSGHASLGGLGSTAFEVLHQVNIPVLIVPKEISDRTAGGKVTRALRIVLAVDGSEASDDAVVWLNQLAADVDVEISLYSVAHEIVPAPAGSRATTASAGIPVGAVSPVMGGVPGGGVYWMPTESAIAGWEEAAKLAQEDTDKTLQRASMLLTNCPPAHQEMGGGSPGESILKYAHSTDADLIVMGRRSHSLAGNIFNSVSYSVVQHTKVPVLIVGTENGAPAQ